MINQRETAEKAEIARLDGIKRKGVVFPSACLRTRRSRAQLHQFRALGWSKIVRQIAVKESLICK